MATAWPSGDLTGKTRELLNEVVKAFLPEDGHTHLSFREPGSTEDRVLLRVRSGSKAAEVGVELIKLINLKLMQPVFRHCTNVKVVEKMVEVLFAGFKTS